MSASYLLLGQGPLPPDPPYDRSAATPLYDALVDEFRLALRTVPGEQTPEDQAEGPPLRIEPGFASIARRVAVGVPRQMSRHRGAPGDGRTDL